MTGAAGPSGSGVGAFVARGFAALALGLDDRGALAPGKLADLVNGLEQTHRMGVRYPIPTYMKYEPEVG